MKCDKNSQDNVKIRENEKATKSSFAHINSNNSYQQRQPNCEQTFSTPLMHL